MPRRREADPLGVKIGARIRELRKEAGLTLEKLAYESGLTSKGYLSDIERGFAVPTVATLQMLAERLSAEAFDFLVFPEESERAARVDAIRTATELDDDQC